MQDHNALAYAAGEEASTSSEADAGSEDGADEVSQNEADSTRVDSRRSSKVRPHRVEEYVQGVRWDGSLKPLVRRIYRKPQWSYTT